MMHSIELWKTESTLEFVVIERLNRILKRGIMVFKHFKMYLSKHKISSRKPNPTIIAELCYQFSMSDIRKSTNNFDKSHLVGRGVFGAVYRGCLEHNIATTDCTLVAVRQMKGFSFYGLEEFKKEIELLCQLNHPNIISLIGFCDHKDEKIIVFEYTSNGSLRNRLFDRDIEPLSWMKRLEICIGTARGVHYLHSGLKRTIIHGDVNPSNILLDSNMVPKLSEFGFSLRGPRFMSKPKPVQSKVAGTSCIMAHECCLDGTYSDKSDVYAFGVTLLVVVCGKPPTKIFDSLGYFSDTDTDTPIEETIDSVLKKKIAPECWEIYISTVKRCLDIDPNERPTMGEVELQLEHALLLQSEAEIRDNNSNYTLFTNTIIDLTPGPYSKGTTDTEGS